MRGTPTARVLLHWVIISRRWERNQKLNRERPINTDSPCKTKCCDTVTTPQNHRPQKHPELRPFLHLAHTLITYVYSHYSIWSFCHHFPCKNDVLITSTQIEFSNHENTVTYTNFLSIASCRIVNVRYRNDLLVTEIRVVVLSVIYKQYFTKMMCRVVINNFRYSFKITREENNKIILKKLQHREINIKSCN